LFAAYPRASIGIATAVYNTQPFMLVALGAVLFAERLTASKIAWLLTGFSGTLLVAQGAPGEASGSNYVGGITLALGAAFLYAVAAIIAKRLTGVRPHLIALIQVAVGALLLAPLMDFSSLPTTGVSWAALLTIGLVNTGLMYILLYGAIQRLPTHLSAALSFIYPVVAIAVDVIVFDHRFGAMQALGSAAILLSAAAMTVGPSWLAARARYTARRAECGDKIECAKP
jgi:drug/metabolite transporter (DMT)-like permease